MCELALSHLYFFLGPFPYCLLISSLINLQVWKWSEISPAGILLISGLEHDTNRASLGHEGKYTETTLVSGQQECCWGHQHLTF